MVAEDIILKPVVTEKSSMEQALGKYTFEVSKKATKIDIKKAVEKLFKVKVKEVRTITVKGKPKRQGAHQGKTSDWKKAIVTIDTNPSTLSYKTKGGKNATSDKKFETSIEQFGA